EADAGGVLGRKHGACRAGIDQRSDRVAVEFRAHLEMAAITLFQHNEIAVFAADRKRTAWNQTGGDAAGDILQFVAILISRHESENHEEPDGEASRYMAEPHPGAEKGGCKHQPPHAEIKGLCEGI